MSTTPHIRSLYRRLLRELPVKDQTTRTAHQKLSAASPLQKRLRAQLATPPSPPATEASQAAQAEQFVQYVQAQRWDGLEWVGSKEWIARKNDSGEAYVG